MPPGIYESAYSQTRHPSRCRGSTVCRERERKVEHAKTQIIHGLEGRNYRLEVAACLRFRRTVIGRDEHPPVKKGGLQQMFSEGGRR